MDDTLKIFSSLRYAPFLTKGFIKKPVFIEKTYLDFKNNHDITFNHNEQIKIQKDKLEELKNLKIPFFLKRNRKNKLEDLLL